MLEKRGTPVEGVRALFVMNQEDGGFDCPGCAWPDDPSGLKLDICENGVKHVTWELERKQVGRDFFAARTVSELAGWSGVAQSLSLLAPCLAPSIRHALPCSG